MNMQRIMAACNVLARVGRCFCNELYSERSVYASLGLHDHHHGPWQLCQEVYYSSLGDHLSLGQLDCVGREKLQPREGSVRREENEVRKQWKVRLCVVSVCQVQ